MSSIPRANKKQITTYVTDQLGAMSPKSFMRVARGLRQLAAQMDRAAKKTTGGQRLRVILKANPLLSTTMRRYASLLSMEIGATEPVIQADGCASLAATASVDVRIRPRTKS